MVKSGLVLGALVEKRIPDKNIKLITQGDAVDYANVIEWGAWDIYVNLSGTAPKALARSSSHRTWGLFNAEFPICCYGHPNQVLESLSPGLYGPPPHLDGLYLPAVPLLTWPMLYKRVKSA